MHVTLTLAAHKQEKIWYGSHKAFLMLKFDMICQL